VLVLLPPSEGKASSGRGTALKLESLSLPGLTEARQAVLDELVELCAGDEDKAREVLGLSEGLRGEIAKNTELRSAGARPAGEIYTGVLYDALDLASLDTAAKRRAGRSLLVFSGLWGAVRVTDRIPSYRCSMGVRLPGLGALGAHWRAPMAAALPEADGDGPGAARAHPEGGEPLQQGDEGADRTESAGGGRGSRGSGGAGGGVAGPRVRGGGAGARAGGDGLGAGCTGERGALDQPGSRAAVQGAPAQSLQHAQRPLRMVDDEGTMRP
jgi:hypothetical protein